MIDLDRLKQKQLEIMDEIHKVCLKTDLKYYLIAGSCLGAIRHGGFIPWDVDIDIAMPREDYDKFFEESYKLLPDNLEVHTYKTDEVFAKSHGLVCMKNTVLLTQADKDNPQVPRFGVFIDVMPLDKCPNDKKLQNRHKSDYLLLKKLRYYKLSRIYSTNGFFIRLLKRLLRVILLPLSVREINRWQEIVMKRFFDLENCTLWCSMASKYKYEKQLMDKDIYGTPKLAKFEDRDFFIPENPQAYLSKLYNDYMKLPSKEEQEIMYNYFVEFSINN